MKKIIFFCTIWILLLISCNQHSDNDVIFVDLTPCIVIDELSDSTLFRGISYMFNNNDVIYATDDLNGRILKLNTDLNLLGTIGKSGQGPHEFAGIGALSIWKDTILAVNLGGLSLNAYTDYGQYIDRYSFTNDPSLTVYSFCIDNEGYIYFTSLLDSFPVIKYDRKMNRQFGFGEWIEPENKQFRIFLNNFIPFYFDNKILTLQVDAPVINMYGKDGQHLMRKELPTKLFRKRLLFKQNEQKKDAANKRKVYKLFSSITSINNKIFILYVDHDKDNRPFKNKVVELLYENNDFIIKKVYNLSQSNKDWFESIVVTEDNKIIASNASMLVNPSISVYQLD